MRKDLGNKLEFLPLPVTIIATYDKDGNPNAMNAAWSTVYDYKKVCAILAKHKTTENLEVSKAFTLSFATKDTALISDYFGLESGNKVDKIKKANVTTVKSKFVNAPIITEYPLTLECTVESYENELLIGVVKNVSVDTKYLDSNGKIDVDKMNILMFDMVNSTYRTLGENVANAFECGNVIKNK